MAVQQNSKEDAERTVAAQQPIAPATTSSATVATPATMAASQQGRGRMVAQALEPEELGAWLRLVSAPQLGPIRIRRLLEHFGLPVDVCRVRHARLVPFVGQTVADYLLAPPTRAFQHDVEQVARWLEAPHHHFVALGDPAYPPAMLESPDPPPVLYVSGRLELLHPGPKGQPAVAVVGSRHATHAGKLQAQRFAGALGEAGVSVISGLALGIDAVAHESALSTAGGTVAVIGTGADRIYPRANAELAERLAIDGALLSEWPLGTPPRPAHFPRRNRVIAALSAGVLVVEATPHSGSLITAQLAIDYGRDVYAIPGSVEAPYKRGCNRLIREGAMLVETPMDLLAALGLASPEADARPECRERASRSVAVASVPDAAGDADGRAVGHAGGSVPVSDPCARAVLDALGHDPASLDLVVARTGMSGAQVQAAVSALELDGQIEWLASGHLSRIVS